MDRDFTIIDATVFSPEEGPREEKILAEVDDDGLVYHLNFPINDDETLTLSPTLRYATDGSVTFAE